MVQAALRSALISPYVCLHTSSWVQGTKEIATIKVSHGLLPTYLGRQLKQDVDPAQLTLLLCRTAALNELT